jgi:hypothetical protein
MAKSSRQNGKRKKHKALPGTYEPVRASRLRGTAVPQSAAEAPSAVSRQLPAATVAEDSAPVGEASGEGVRVLAALEATESLEPSFCDDLLGEEASVTIVEHATPFDMTPLLDVADAPAAPARTGLPRAPQVDAARHAAYHGPIEEAVVEIFEVPLPTPDTAEPPPGDGGAGGPWRLQGAPAARGASKTRREGGSG